MNTSFFIAKRYFLSKKKRNFINIITIMSVVGVMLGAMALIVVLSVFNGLEDLIRSIYGSFDPHLKITIVEGKSFEIDSLTLSKIKKIKYVHYVTEVIEDNTLVKYADKQAIVKIKGVSENFTQQFGINKFIVEGEGGFNNNGIQSALIGRGVQYKLGIDMQNRFYQLQFWYPKNQKKLQLNPEKAFNNANLYPAGIFALEKQYDDFYVFVSLKFAQELMDYGSKRTALELNLTDIAQDENVKYEIGQLVGSKFDVKTADEQHAGMLRAIKIEKLFVYITFTFIMAVSSLNIFFTLTMLAIEKKKDVAMLYNLGATRSMVRNIFLFEGLIIGTIGAISGLILGGLICFLQQEYGFVSMGTETSLVNSYPVKMRISDFFLTGFIIFALTTFISLQPALKAARRQ
jgi:lipoprotein-releasing system permease protein